MINRHYATLFVRGDPLTLLGLRSSLHAGEIDAYPKKYSRVDVGADVGTRYHMISYRMAMPPMLEVFDALAARWPSLQFVLLHRTFGHEPANGFAIYEQGRRVRYGGTSVGLGDEDRHTLIAYPTWKLFGRHMLPPETIDKRLGVCDIDLGDDGDRSEAEDW